MKIKEVHIETKNDSKTRKWYEKERKYISKLERFSTWRDANDMKMKGWKDEEIYLMSEREDSVRNSTALEEPEVQHQRRIGPECGVPVE